jgi:GNAT superfamily N-acetyltransferase
MVTIEKVDVKSKQQVNAFVQFQYDLYKNVPQYCPPFVNDVKLMLSKEKHPFYEHSEGDFFVAKEKGEIVGRVGVFVNHSFNEYHQVKKGQFYLFDSVDDQDVANKLFEKGFDWCKERGLNDIVGPKGLAAFDGFGILVEGFEHHQMMTMMNYNFDYYPKLIEAIGFEKEVDFVSCYLHQDHFSIPEKVREVARRVKERGNFVVHNFKSKRELVRNWADKIGKAYNKTFINNWEYYPMTNGEVKLLVDNLLIVADPRLIKIITYNDEIAGFLLAFPDISSSLKRHHGRITPIGLADMMIDLKRTKWVALNGAGVLPEYHGRGGNALMYYEIEKTIKDYGFIHAELTQVAETAVQMRKDLISVGGQPYKNHRVYHKSL